MQTEDPIDLSGQYSDIILDKTYGKGGGPFLPLCPLTKEAREKHNLEENENDWDIFRPSPMCISTLSQALSPFAFPDSFTSSDMVRVNIGFDPGRSNAGLAAADADTGKLLIALQLRAENDRFLTVADSLRELNIQLQNYFERLAENTKTPRKNFIYHRGFVEFQPQANFNVRMQILQTGEFLGILNFLGYSAEEVAQQSWKSELISAIKTKFRTNFGFYFKNFTIEHTNVNKMTRLEVCRAISDLLTVEERIHTGGKVGNNNDWAVAAWLAKRYRCL